MKFYLSIITVLLFTLNGFSQSSKVEKPKLVVGIVVDQMRNDYIDRFWNRYGENGFKKLVNEGYRFKNNQYNYIPTQTGPGHASIYSGTSPINHGIISNNWYDKTTNEMVYCAGDPNAISVGTLDKAGKMSPQRMKSTSIADENRLATQLRGKTIGVAIKDRGAILPAGHTANAAYWFHGKNEGKFISSSYYIEKLPNWVNNFNNSGKATSYLKTWNTLYPIASYIESGLDLNEYEKGFKGKENANFPYDLKNLMSKNGGFDILKSTAYGNDLTTDFAKAAIEGESLGMDNDTDFLTLSYSSTDYVGHNFGVNSKEIQDTYLRLDNNIADLLQFLDKKVGKGNYTIFLTADHAAVDVTAYLESTKIPSGNFDVRTFRKNIEQYVEKEFGDKNLISYASSNLIFFNYNLLEKLKIDFQALQQKLSTFVLSQDKVHQVYTRNQIVNGAFTVGMDNMIKNGFNHKRSGDIVYILEPSVVPSRRTGSTHGSGFSYDTHVPLLFYGNGIKHGQTAKRSEIVDIAPTIASLLNISFPNGTTGEPLYIMLDK